MPIQNGKYVNPGWVDGQEPAIDAEELNAMSNTIASTEQQAITTAQGLANFISGTYNPFVQNVYTKDQVYTKSQVLSGSTAQLFGQSTGALPDLIFQTISTMINMNCEIHEFSYSGTGLSGVGNPNSISAEKPIILAAILFYKDDTGRFYSTSNGRSSDNDPTQFMLASTLTETFVDGIGFGDPTTSGIGGNLYGKKSSDGKIFYWYADSNASNQFNVSGYTYYGFYIC